MNKKEVKDKDKASMLSPLFIKITKKDDESLSDKLVIVSLFDELVKKYNSNSQYNFKEIFDNISEKAKKYLSKDYLSKSSSYKEIFETKELKPNENVKIEKEQNNQPILEIENYSLQKSESPHSDLSSSKSLNEDEKTEKES